MGYPSVFPTGVLQFDKDKTWSGYTIFPPVKGALLIDMNGNEVNLWAGLGGPDARTEELTGKKALSVPITA